jgi:hypothetical protein
VAKRSAPVEERAASWSEPNLTKRLHSRSGFGVRPAEYSERKGSNTLVQYSRTSSGRVSGMRKREATACASRKSRSSWHSELSPRSSAASQVRAKAALTEAPARRSSRALTAESTPPERPIATRRPATRGASDATARARAIAGAGRGLSSGACLRQVPWATPLNGDLRKLRPARSAKEKEAREQAARRGAVRRRLGARAAPLLCGGLLA